ncbi:hypothetical protein ACSAZL_13695 [Methanosarcina sp. T3]|uniref:hypothetical protein n=1 Tax=Methanosarcina sp. T3 TaxID=3439062 RepID=UPI003F84B527
MKNKLLTLGTIAVLLCTVFMVSTASASPKGIDLEGCHYNLNIIGKKVDWNGGGSYDNPDRHTIFVPEDTAGFSIPVYDEGVYTEVPGVQIRMSQGEEFAVLDGNAFDDGVASFQLAPGKYKVYITAKGKPGGSTDVTGWVKCNETYYFDIGSLTVSKKPVWDDATDLFYVNANEEPGAIDLVSGEPMWVFDYLEALYNYDAILYPDPLYLWQYDNNGNKLVQVRFYPV